MLNKIVIMGRFTREPEIKYTQSQLPVTSFTLAVDRDYSGKDNAQKETDFINCVAWRNTADFVSKYFHKGSMAVVAGRLQIRQYTDRDGNKRTAAEVVADSVYFAESKHSDAQTTAQSELVPTAYTAPANAYTPPYGELEDMGTAADGELPF